MQFTKNYERRHHLDNSILVKCPVGTEIVSVKEIDANYYRVITATPVTKNSSRRLSMYRDSIEFYTDIQLNN